MPGTTLSVYPIGGPEFIAYEAGGIYTSFVWQDLAEPLKNVGDGHKDGADYSYRGKENGHASEECALSRDRASRSSPGPIPSSCPGVKKTQTHSCVQSKHSQVTGKDERMLKALRPDDTPPLEFLPWTLSCEHAPICTLEW